MKIIAESSSTRTEWALVEGTEMIEHAFTAGLNPYFHSRRDISHIIRLQLPRGFFRRRWEHIHMYCAGCSTIDKTETVHSSLVTQFRTPTTVHSDLLGAARGLLIHSPGLACILGTGSNSCHYDGEEITRNVLPLGYILGDEGSAAHIGRTLLADILKEIAPDEIIRTFYDRFQTSADALLDTIYTAPLPQRMLSSYTTLVAEMIDHPYMSGLVYDSFTQFYRRNIAQYDVDRHEVNFVGSTAVNFRPILEQVANDNNFRIGRVIKYSLPGLIEYHATANQEAE